MQAWLITTTRVFIVSSSYIAMCDAKYCFTFLEIGGSSSTNDANILLGALFVEMFENNPTDLNIPRPSFTT